MTSITSMTSMTRTTSITSMASMINMTSMTSMTSITSIIDWQVKHVAIFNSVIHNTPISIIIIIIIKKI